MRNVGLWVSIAAFLDTMYTVITDNQGLLIELGLSEKWTKVIMLAGLIWTAVSKSIIAKKEVVEPNYITPSGRSGKGRISPDKPM